MKRMLLASSSSSISPTRFRKLLVKLCGKQVGEIKVMVMSCPENKTKELDYGRKMRKLLKAIGVRS